MADVARVMRALAAAVKRNEADPEFRARYAANERRRKREAYERDLACAIAGLSGKWGLAHQELAVAVLLDEESGAMRQDPASIAVYMGEARKLKRNGQARDIYAREIQAGTDARLRREASGGRK